jgi:UDP-N-acetylmuramate--alanine ligase
MTQHHHNTCTAEALAEILAHGHRVHFIGIGGISMSSLARYLLARGWQVSGSDMTDSRLLGELRREGTQIAIGHDAANLPDVDLVVLSDAIALDNPELLATQQRNLPLVRRSLLLGQLTAQRKVIAISGTHGKTTTTAMVTWILAEADLSPTMFLGAEYPPLGGNLRIGDGDWAVVEACEAFASFLDLQPTIAVVTNLEPEHLDYHGTEAALHQAFVDFLAQLGPQGTAVVSLDDANLSTLCNRAGVKNVLGFALHTVAPFSAADITFTEKGSEFSLLRPGEATLRVQLQVPGEHNIANALAALAAASAAGVPVESAAKALVSFVGASRRFQILFQGHGITIVDDYAHHPTELRATLAAARQRRSGRVLAIFQPHLYTRTQTFMREFAEIMAGADLAWVTDIYPAREAPIPNVTAGRIAELASQEFGGNVTYLPFATVAATVVQHLQEGDIVVVMGAGNVDSIARSLAATLGHKFAGHH